MSHPFEVFNHPAFGFVRVVVKEGEPWFVGKDVAEVLGYKDASRALFDHVDTEDKTSLLIQQSGSNYKAKTTFINESGLYSLMLRSKLPQAKDFKRWVTSEVLPSIRTHGGYLTPEKLGEALTNQLDTTPWSCPPYPFCPYFSLVCSNNSSKGFHI